MLRVVIDTNCLRASIPPKSPFYQLYVDFMAGKFEWFVSTEILLEYEEILTATYSQKTSQLVLNQLAIAPNVVFTEPAFVGNSSKMILMIINLPIWLSVLMQILW